MFINKVVVGENHVRYLIDYAMAKKVECTRRGRGIYGWVADSQQNRVGTNNNIIIQHV